MKYNEFDVIKKCIHEYLDYEFDKVQIRVRNAFYIDIYLWVNRKKYAFYTTKYFIYYNGVVWLRKCIMRDYEMGRLHEMRCLHEIS